MQKKNLKIYNIYKAIKYLIFKQNDAVITEIFNNLNASAFNFTLYQFYNDWLIPLYLKSH